MKLLDKIAFLQKAMNLTDREFSARYGIKNGKFRKFKLGIINLPNESFLNICHEFSLDLNDFLDDSSTLDKELKEGEHLCKLLDRSTTKETILEDFAREDNSRYEEKD